MNLDSVAGPLSQAHVLIVLLLILLLLEFSFKGGHSLGGISKVSSRLIQVVLRRPSSPLDQIVDHIFDLPLVLNFLNFPLILGVLQIRHHHKTIAIFSVAVTFKQLDWKDIM